MVGAVSAHKLGRGSHLHHMFIKQILLTDFTIAAMPRSYYSPVVL